MRAEYRSIPRLDGSSKTAPRTTAGSPGSERASPRASRIDADRRRSPAPATDAGNERLPVYLCGLSPCRHAAHDFRANRSTGWARLGERSASSEPRNRRLGGLTDARSSVVRRSSPSRSPSSNCAATECCFVDGHAWRAVTGGSASRRPGFLADLLHLVAHASSDAASCMRWNSANTSACFAARYFVILAFSRSFFT